MVAATLYGLVSAWLLFPLFGVPRVLTRSAALLAWLEFLSALAWGYTSEGCARGSCSPLAEAARTAAGVDLPALSIAVVVLAIAHGIRRWRRGEDVEHAPSEDVARSR